MYPITARPASTEEPSQEVVRTVQRARSDPAAFQPLYEQYFPRVYRYCLRRVSCLQEAEDLTSLIFTRALANLATYRGGFFAAWLFRIAHNAVVNHLRDRRVSVPLDEIEMPAGDDLLNSLIDAEERARIAGLIAALPDEQRDLLALKVAGGLSAREIGQVVGKSEGAVRVAFHRIVQRLRVAWVDDSAASRRESQEEAR